MHAKFWSENMTGKDYDDLAIEEGTIHVMNYKQTGCGVSQKSRDSDS